MDNDPDNFFNTAKAVSVRSEAGEHRYLQIMFEMMLDLEQFDKVVNHHLKRRAQQEAAKADFFSHIADWFSGKG